MNNALQEDGNSLYNLGLVLASFLLHSNATKSRAVGGDDNIISGCCRRGPGFEVYQNWSKKLFSSLARAFRTGVFFSGLLVRPLRCSATNARQTIHSPL